MAASELFDGSSQERVKVMLDRDRSLCVLRIHSLFQLAFLLQQMVDIQLGEQKLDRRHFVC